jgi:hypothetical protein
MDVDLVCEFIRRGANLHTGPSANMLPLHVLYRSGRFDVLMYALQKENIRAYVPKAEVGDVEVPVDWFCTEVEKEKDSNTNK